MLVVLSSALLIAMNSIAILNTNKEYFNNNFELLKEVDQQSSRLKMWENSVSLFKKSPIIGMGKNNWETEIGQFGYTDYRMAANDNFRPRMYSHAHSWFFQTIAELGILGLLFFFIICLSCFLSLRKNKTIDQLSYAALFSALSFLWLGLMYGVIYNQSGRFSGLTVLLVLGIAILNRYSKFKFTIAKKSSGTIIFICSLLCLAFFFTSLQNKKKSQRGEILIRKKKYTEALSILETVDLSWDKSKIYSQTARAQAGLKNDSLSADFYLKAINSNPYDVNLLYNYSKSLYNLRDYENAIHYSSKVFELAENFLTNELHIIECLYKTGDSEKVIERGNKLHQLMIAKLDSYRLLLNYDLPDVEERVNAQKVKEYKKMKLRLEEILVIPN